MGLDLPLLGLRREEGPHVLDADHVCGGEATVVVVLGTVAMMGAGRVTVLTWRDRIPGRWCAEHIVVYKNESAQRPHGIEQSPFGFVIRRSK